MELIARGAEAEVWKGKFLGIPAVFKRRVPKKYRLPELDREIRVRRTRREARLLVRAKEAGVNTPAVLYLRPAEIVMEYVEGSDLRTGNLRDFELMGEYVALLHGEGMVHGDLTPANVLKSRDLVFIDFGLGFFTRDVEDFAVDILVLKKTLLATGEEEKWVAFLRGYSWPMAERVLKRMEKVERRARYL